MSLTSCLRNFIGFLSLLLVLSPVRAESVDGLFTVEVPVTGSQAAAREQGLREAFELLVVRLTGRQDALDAEGLAELKLDPQPVINRYETGARSLRVSFEPVLVERALRNAGLGVWGRDRPSILLWWLQDVQLVGGDHSMASVLRQAGQHWGLPLHLPLADLDEQLTLTPGTLETQGIGALSQVAARYDADAQLGVAVTGSAGNWRGNWQLERDGRTESGTAEAATVDALADAVMRQAQAVLAATFTAPAAQASSVLVVIESVDLGDYAEMNRLLAPLGGQLLGLDEGNLTYRVRAVLSQLQAQMRLARLQAVSEGDRDPATGLRVLRYRRR